jgi:hypothetical protein
LRQDSARARAFFERVRPAGEYALVVADFANDRAQRVGDADGGLRVLRRGATVGDEGIGRVANGLHVVTGSGK